MLEFERRGSELCIRLQGITVARVEHLGTRMEINFAHEGFCSSASPVEVAKFIRRHFAMRQKERDAWRRLGSQCK